ncbi:DJ-1/PfpI family protein [Mycoplasma todarodis]|uniref:DJ-1/PfpI family protein n=1 Tax=Mycoplasma todarodis TaxID=1937191 RepID=UPI003B2E1D05
MKNIAILVADGFEDTELIGAIDYWTRENIDFELISIQNKTEVRGSYFAKVDTKPISEISFDDFENLFIPGGKSTSLFKKYQETTNILLDFNGKNKGIFAICAAPSLLFDAGILKNHSFTCWPGLELKKSTNTECEVDKNIITGRDYLSTMTFAKEVAKFIKKK